MFTTQRLISGQIYRNCRNVIPVVRCFKSIRINPVETTNVSSSEAMAAEITLAKQKIDLYLESKEAQEKVNPENNSITPITPMFTLLNTNGAIVDGPKEFNDGINELEPIFAKMPNITIDFDNFEKTSNQCYAYWKITGDFSNYQKHVSQYKHLANIKSKQNALLKWFSNRHIINKIIIITVASVIITTILSTILSIITYAVYFLYFSVIVAVVAFVLNQH